jgi:hypothetical protein
LPAWNVTKAVHYTGRMKTPVYQAEQQANKSIVKATLHLDTTLHDTTHDTALRRAKLLTR